MAEENVDIVDHLYFISGVESQNARTFYLSAVYKGTNQQLCWWYRKLYDGYRMYLYNLPDFVLILISMRVFMISIMAKNH